MGLGNNYALTKQTLGTEGVTMLQKNVCLVTSEGVNITVTLGKTWAKTTASPF